MVSLEPTARVASPASNGLIRVCLGRYGAALEELGNVLWNERGWDGTLPKLQPQL